MPRPVRLDHLALRFQATLARCALWVGLGLGSLGALPAAAQVAPRIAVVGVHEADLDLEAQASAIDLIVEAIDVTGRADGLDTTSVTQAIAGREEVILQEALLAGGRQDLINGKNLYNQAQTEDAIYALQSAVESLSVAVRSTNTTKELWEAWVYLGTAYLSIDQPEEAKTSFRAAAALNPDRNPNPALFPPNVIETYVGQRGLLQTVAVSLKIQIDSEATIFLDGVEKGSQTVSLDGVLPGMHHIVAKGPGGYAYKLVRVEQSPTGAAPDVVLALGPPVLGAAGDSPIARGRQIAGLYRALGAHAQDVELFLLAGTDEGQLHVQLYAPAADAFSAPLVLEPSDGIVDATVQAMPGLLENITQDGKINADATSPVAAPLWLDANQHLASMLLDPRGSQAQTIPPPPTTQTKKSPVVPILAGVLTAGALGAGGYLGYNALSGGGSDDGQYKGVVIIGPISR